MNKNTNCNNCGKPGHLFSNCKMPITSSGVIAFRKAKNGTYEYLLIRRKETLGYIDFMRGKYSVNNKEYIMNMMKQMTNYEKERLSSVDFDELWKDIWGEGFCNSRYKLEESVSRDKHSSLVAGITLKNDSYTLNSIIMRQTTIVLFASFVRKLVIVILRSSQYIMSSHLKRYLLGLIICRINTNTFWYIWSTKTLLIWIITSDPKCLR